MMDLKVARARGTGTRHPLPSYATAGASGLDLVADCDTSLTILPQHRKAIPTGIVVELPVGYEGQIRTRSGIALHSGVFCLNSPGTIDSDYRGELIVILANFGDSPFTIAPGDKVAQLVVAPVARVALVEVDTLTPTVRGTGGFGSTDP